MSGDDRRVVAGVGYGIRKRIHLDTCALCLSDDRFLATTIPSASVVDSSPVRRMIRSTRPSHASGCPVVGFTLLEMMIVVGIIGVLATLAIAAVLLGAAVWSLGEALKSIGAGR